MIVDVDVTETEVPNSVLEKDSIEQILPPHNRNASKVDKVYLISDIFTKEELASAQKEVTKIIEDNNFEKCVSNNCYSFNCKCYVSMYKCYL